MKEPIVTRRAASTRAKTAPVEPRTSTPPAGIQRIHDWFASRGWTPFPFQLDAWRAYLSGRSGLVHAPTGMGKSLSVWMGPVIEALDETQSIAPPKSPTTRPRLRADQRRDAEPIRALWITPMRALATDTVKSLTLPLADLGLNWTIEKRTGDTSASLKLKQREQLPTCLVTTPESLTLLLSYPHARERFATLRCVIVDEWHELLSSKRGTQTELALARLRAWHPALRTWGLSATLGNTREALDVLIGSREPQRLGSTQRDAALETASDARPSPPEAVLVPGETIKEINIATILPDDAARFPWSGHLGLRLLPKVLREIERCGTSLLFTNTRSQAEIWYRALSEARPDWLGRIAIHHGSIDRDVREEVEKRLREGVLLCVVCTSSLDLGVDFSPVEQVIQVGSPKGVARLMQRAGRSGHQPGALSTVVCVPTNAMELLEFAAARDAIRQAEIERREPLNKPLDVLAQHLVTIGLAGGFDEASMLDEVRGAWSYRDLSDDEWRWAMEFVTTGGPTLRAYPQYARLLRDAPEVPPPAPGSPRYRVASPAIERNHRLGIGTITSDASVRVAYSSGRTLGTIEEGFISKLNPGDRFVFAGQLVELIRVHQMTAHVAKAKKGGAVIARWDGGRSPLSSQLAGAVRRRIDAARRALDTGDPTIAAEVFDCPEMIAARSLLSLQARWSRLPSNSELLLEAVETRDGHHVFLFPFEGRLVHEGLGALVAHRLARRSPRSLSVTSNDAGIEWLSPTALPDDEASWREALSTDNLLEDLMSCLNSTELTRRQFRDIARVAGLIIPSFPGQGGKSTRQVQASSSLFFDVFTEFDPGNMLLDQARREVLEQQLELRRLRATLTRLASHRLVIVRPQRLTPFSFALWAEGIRTQQVTSERWSDRVQRMAAVLEQEADGGNHAQEPVRGPRKLGRTPPGPRR
jgi:ATP-dependent Lhr-like helicase